MRRCVICHDPDVVADDVAVVGSERPERCICLRCWEREIGGTIYMSRDLIRELIAAAGKDDTK